MSLHGTRNDTTVNLTRGSRTDGRTDGKVPKELSQGGIEPQVSTREKGILTAKP
jgi:hypothetical protein